MASELHISISMTFSKGGAKISHSFSDTIDVAGDSFQHSVQAVGTTEETFTCHADIGTIGYVFLKNLDATNYVEIGRTTGVYTVKLLAGEGAIFRLDAGTSLYGKANTASCNVEYIFIEL